MFFAIGGIGYGIIELLWRGYTHWSMIIAGGICFIGFSIIAEKFNKKPLICKAVLCSVCVTGVELVFGIIFNIILKMNIWDYSNMPFNLLGQISLLFSVAWGFLGFFLTPLVDKLNKKFQSNKDIKII